VAGKIGLLALQGAFAKHEEALKKLGVETVQVRYADDLNQCQAMIIPGGESTVMHHHLKERHLIEPLKSFAQSRPIFGTCAGMILMANEGLLDISISRNAYGRQSASFSTQLSLSFTDQPIEAFFIRAPRIRAILSPNVAILATLGNEPVLVQQGLHLAASFHPELTNNLTIHQYFVNYAL
jgi:pyridoxal 5'-phosphate synthase pdxT subunit